MGIEKLPYDDTDVIGLEDDKEKVEKQLVDPENKNRTVISTAGMGGLGRSTLARKVYNEPVIRKHFDTFAWVIELPQGIAEKAMGIKKKEETTSGIITLQDSKK
ncbi:putative disease resistance protein [Cocos nucifera]|uniref:Putative disease resistance protein n=1 Tax=Cocos nucifera TaxID=13894 RepID=A0A8K0HSY2_COCNU|nr:putative disease resistance protein [Cocos nucifera]